MIWMVMLYVDGVQQAFGLRFRSKGAATDTYERIEKADDSLSLEDDFGQKVTLYPSRLCALHLIDVAREQEANGEMRMMQARAEEKLQQTMDALRPSAMSGQATRQMGPTNRQQVRPQ